MSTRSAATTCRRPSSGRSCASTCRSCTTPTGSTARPACSTTSSREHGADRPCLHAPGATTWSYADLLAAANRIAHVLVDDLGVVPGNRVLLRGPNNPWLTACWFGVLKAGAVAVTTMPLLRAGELATIHEISRLDVALVDHRFVEGTEGLGVRDACRSATTRAGHAWRQAGPPTSHDVATVRRRRGPAGVHLRHDRPPEGDHALPPRRAGDLRHLLPPRAAPGARRRLHRHAAVTRSRSGWAGCCSSRCTPGASTLLVEKATPDELADIIDEHRRDRLLHRARRRTRRCSPPAASCRRCRQGGLGRRAPAGRDLAGVPRRDRRARSSTGSAPPRCCTSSSPRRATTSGPGSTGRAVPGYVATVLDERATERRAGRAGPAGGQGPDRLPLPRRPAAGRRTSRAAGTSPATPSIRDEDGYFWYHARSDDMIVSSGYNIAGPEVEEALLRHPDVAECAVVGVPDEARGSLVKAYVVLAAAVTGDELSATELQDFAKAEIAPYKYPRSVDFVDALPRTPTGKLQRFRLRDDRTAKPTRRRGADPLALRPLRARGGRLALGRLADRADGRAGRALRRRCAVVGVPAEEARRARGVERHDGQAGYALSPASLALLREGDGRIWSRPRATAADGWLVAGLLGPGVAARPAAHALRSLLTRPRVRHRRRPVSGSRPARCTTRPVRALERAGADGLHRVLPRRPTWVGDVTARMGEWWDLEAIAKLYDEFLAAVSALRRARRLRDRPTRSRRTCRC